MVQMVTLSIQANSTWTWPSHRTPPARPDVRFAVLRQSHCSVSARQLCITHTVQDCSVILHCKYKHRSFDVTRRNYMYTQLTKGFDSRQCHWNFSLKQTFRSHYGPYSTSNINEYQGHLLGSGVGAGGKAERTVRLTTLPPSCADCHKIW